MTTLRGIGLCLSAGMSLFSGLAEAAPGTLIGDRWPLLGFTRQGDCELAITSSGRAMQLRARGLIPGEALHLRLTSGDMVPIERNLHASTDGTVLQYYLPFRLNRDGGIVAVTLDSARCQLTAAAPWTRGLVTIP